MAAWAIEAQKSMIHNMSQEGYFVNGQGLVVYLKIFKIIFVNEMTSLIRLLVGFEYNLSARKTVIKWLHEEWKICTHMLHTVTQQTQITVRRLSYFAQPVK